MRRFPKSHKLISHHELECARLWSAGCGITGPALRPWLQDATGCTVAVPSKDSGRDDIRITGPSAASVSSALTRIELLLERALSGPAVPYTHFVSLPLNAPAVCAAVDAFKAEVLATALPEEGLGEDIFPPSAQIHLTLVMLKARGARPGCHHRCRHRVFICPG